MANAYQTAADLLKLNNLNARDVGASNVLDGAPFLRALAAVTATQGNKHTFTRESAAPAVGFRGVNTGRDLGKSGQEEVSVDLKILSANSAVDQRVASAYVKGGKEAFIARELRRQLVAAFTAVESALVNGDTDAGFSGLRTALSTLSPAGANRQVIGAGGVTNDGALTSIYFVRTNDLETDCNLILGNEGEIAIGDTFEQLLNDADGKPWPAFVTTCEGWVGLQVASRYSVFRLANINATNKTLTDSLLADMYAEIPEDREPSFILMNKRSATQLMKSRQATSTTGGQVPLPREWEGIPIVLTRGITNSEAQVVAP